MAISLLGLLGGCSETEEPSVGATDTTSAKLDTRGGAIAPTAQLGASDTASGDSGDGGSIRIVSAAGDVLITAADPGVTPRTPLIAGVGLDIVSGGVVTVNGARTVDHLRVREGATLILTGDTLFDVSGDVDISGTITRRFSGPAIDGHDLTIRAGGIVNVTGTIDLRGRSNVISEDNLNIGGGVGGRVFISAGGGLSGSAGPHMFISGTIDVSGGNTDANFLTSLIARAGVGGNVFLGVNGTLVLTGDLLSRGGRSGIGDQLFFADGSAANGGTIELIALRDITIGEALEISADAGDSHGFQAGFGGTIAIEAPAGDIDVSGTDITARGGDVLLATSSQAGDGGSASFYADAVVLDDTLIDASGGSPGDSPDAGAGPVEGAGGLGGDVELGVITTLSASASTTLRARGGNSQFVTAPGAKGGSVKLINLDEGDLSVIDFQGVVEAQAGIDAFGSNGEPGEICQRGASAATISRITNNNPYPISSCAVDNEGAIQDVNFVTHDLDCDEETLFPSRANATIPTVTGVEFYRIHVGSATSVTISVAGEPGGDIDIFTGDDTLLGSLDLSSYGCSSQTPNTSSEELTVDFGACPPGQFLTLLVIERSPFVEEYTISVTCSE